MSADKKLIAGGNRDRPLDLRLMALGQQERGDAGKINTRLKLQHVSMVAADTAVVLFELDVQ